MKKFYLLVVFTMMFGNVYSQTKRPAMRRSSTTTKKIVVKEEKTDEQLAIEKAQVWFKDKYVETVFKDPYSYRVVGIKAAVVTNGDYLDRNVSKVKKLMDDFLETQTSNPEESRETIKGLIKDCEDAMEQNKDNYLYDRFKKERDKCVSLLDAVEVYFTYKEEYEKLMKLKNETSVEELNSIIFYDIHLDCYSKNDIGNEVLGRFVFPFTKDGPYIDDKTTLENVEKVN